MSENWDGEEVQGPSVHVSNSLELGMVSHEITGAAFQGKHSIFTNSVSEHILHPRQLHS